MVAAVLNLSLVLWKTKTIFAQSHNWCLAVCSYKHSHGSFITIIWESPRAVQKPSNLCLPHKGLWHAAEVAVLWRKLLALVTEEKQEGVERKFKQMWGFSVYLQSFVSLSYEKVMCKYIQPNLTEKTSVLPYDMKNKYRAKASGIALAESTRASCNAFGFTHVLIMGLHVPLCFSILSPMSPHRPGSFPWAPAPVWAVGPVVVESGLLLSLLS